MIAATGIGKQLKMEYDARGRGAQSEYVCVGCVDDYAIAAAIASAQVPIACSFCDSTSAAHLDTLIEAFMAGIYREYNTADDELIPYDSAEGGYQFFAGRGYDSWDLVEEFNSIFLGDGLIDAVKSNIDQNMWVDRNYVFRPFDEALGDAWDLFCEAVKFHTRHVFWLVDDPDEHEAWQTGEVPPGKVLQEVGKLVEKLGLVKEVETGTSFWRAQLHSGPTLEPAPTARRLGTARREHAKQPNRMSPAGIPMFYGAHEQVTAIAEVCGPRKDNCGYVTSGKFAVSQSILIVDFSQIPPAPSIFDSQWGDLRREIRFLNRFVALLSAPILPQDKSIDYVPTQILTEYFLRVFECDAGGKISGIKYSSAAKQGGTAVVLDIPNDQCIDDGEQIVSEVSLVLDVSSVSTSEV